MNIYKIYAVILPYFRRKRGIVFHKIMKPKQTDTILDIGGLPDEVWTHINCNSHITCLNLSVSNTTYDKNKFDCVEGDGRDLHYPDNEFNITFSNSVIEHVGAFAEQKKFADEIRRVGKSYWVQTPNKWFFFEPHLLTPFIHYLPTRIQRKILRYFSVWGLITKPSRKEVDDFLATVRLLSKNEMVQLFPDAMIYHEKFLFFTKSFIAYKLDGEQHPHSNSTNTLPSGG